MDLEEAFFIRNKEFSHNVKFLPTNNFSSLSESELVIICAGLFADEKEKNNIICLIQADEMCNH